MRLARAEAARDELSEVGDERQVAVELESFAVGDDVEGGRPEPRELAKRRTDIGSEPQTVLQVLVGRRHDPRVQPDARCDDERPPSVGFVHAVAAPLGKAEVDGPRNPVADDSHGRAETADPDAGGEDVAGPGRHDRERGGPTRKDLGRVADGPVTADRRDER